MGEENIKTWRTHEEGDSTERGGPGGNQRFKTLEETWYSHRATSEINGNPQGGGETSESRNRTHGVRPLLGINEEGSDHGSNQNVHRGTYVDSLAATNRVPPFKR